MDGVRVRVASAYATFALLGVGIGASGVLLPAQLDDYGVDRATLGLTFLTGSAGFVLGGAAAGPLLHRWGPRTVLAAAGVLFAVAALVTAAHPPFVGYALLQAVVGWASGVLESVLNAVLAALPGATTRLNRLHAFFGAGALLGPVGATRLLATAPWPTTWLVLGLAALPLVACYLVAFPARAPASSPTRSTGLLGTALRHRGVLVATLLLVLYVGLEQSVGSWGFSYLVQARGHADAAAGYAVGAYWLGLTVGRFTISPVLTRLGWTAVGLMTLCLSGVAVAAAALWLTPFPPVAGFALLGFALGPVFPTAIAVVPDLVGPRLAPTAMGVLNAGSSIGGGVLPWSAGALAQAVGVGTLLPFALALAVLQLVVWWPVARLVRSGPTGTV
ncbi:sugar MFS transporter [Saccharothrix longispora]|uniref:Fucose permease n=1 Tax=Saccharothrix longispora TaxID=33920 RepID=A0ABU1PRK6_9PSEU|nr:MFS transporter [Saccharothrix longispora]MDR6593280.1 fucose permease [Saccharothrix longispora]